MGQGLVHRPCLSRQDFVTSSCNQSKQWLEFHKVKLEPELKNLKHNTSTAGELLRWGKEFMEMKRCLRWVKVEVEEQVAGRQVVDKKRGFHLQTIVQAEALAGRARGAALPLGLMRRLSTFSTSDYFILQQKHQHTHSETIKHAISQSSIMCGTCNNKWKCCTVQILSHQNEILCNELKKHFLPLDNFSVKHVIISQTTASHYLILRQRGRMIYLHQAFSLLQRCSPWRWWLLHGRTTTPSINRWHRYKLDPLAHLNATAMIAEVITEPTVETWQFAYETERVTAGSTPLYSNQSFIRCGILVLCRQCNKVNGGKFVSRANKWLCVYITF